MNYLGRGKERNVNERTTGFEGYLSIQAWIIVSMIVLRCTSAALDCGQSVALAGLA